MIGNDPRGWNTTGIGTIEGAIEAPAKPDAWKRALYRRPPRQFVVELLPPTKQGRTHAYGMRICPFREDSRSSSSGSSYSEYEVSRRWEDWLWFQDCLEVEYERMARAKRKRLVAGKGVKKNGVYTHRDLASSFDSLPPGPDPKSVARDIHDYIPRLTKKGTVFRASQATIDQRYKELQACITSLFGEDAPTLVRELRESRRVTDFFGYWGRDFDLALRQQTEKNPEKMSRNSITSSVFSTYFSASNPTLSMMDTTLVNPPNTKSLSSQKSSRKGKTPSSTFSVKSSVQSSSDDFFYRDRGSSGSSNSSVGPPSPSSCFHGSPSPYIVPHDAPVVFGHNPMETLVEEELVAPMSGMKIPHDSKSYSPRWRAHNNTADRSGNWNVQMGSFDKTENLSPDSSLNRLSWQTTTSTATINPSAYLADLDTDLTLPKSPNVVSHFPRESFASLASIMTDNSADAIIPLSSQARNQRSSSDDSSRTLSDPEGSFSDPDDDLLSYFDESFGRPASPTPESRPETPVGELPSPISMFSSHSSVSQHSRSRSRSSTVSDFTSSDCSTISSGDGGISIKVVHNRSIILLRIQRNISFPELRAKVYEKFVQQERVPLSESFAIAVLPPAPIDYSKPRARSSSMSAVGFPNLAHMRFISSQRDWEHAMASAIRGKLTLQAVGEQGV